jgi:hypothetical protein
MIRNWKFHALALSIICVIIIALYFAIGPKKQAPVDPNAAIGDRFVQVYSATWGANCNEYIDRENADRARLRLNPKPGGDPHALEPLHSVINDNVLVRLGEKCNGKISCNFPASSEAIGVEPFEACFKRLTIGYRCFTYDRLRTLDANQGDLVAIDCHEETAPATP